MVDVLMLCRELGPDAVELAARGALARTCTTVAPPLCCRAERSGPPPRRFQV
jgi:hypothetical protein